MRRSVAAASGLQVSQYLLLLLSPLTPPASLTTLPPLQHVFSSMRVRAPPALPLAEVDDDQIEDDNQSL
jgi:hypothetical protein